MGHITKARLQAKMGAILPWRRPMTALDGARGSKLTDEQYDGFQSREALRLHSQRAHKAVRLGRAEAVSSGSSRCRKSAR